MYSENVSQIRRMLLQSLIYRYIMGGSGNFNHYVWYSMTYTIDMRNERWRFIQGSTEQEIKNKNISVFVATAAMRGNGLSI